MNWTRLIFRNLWFYRKPYLAVLAGVVISIAVLTGALIVGDSVRFSLKHLTGIRLGKIKYALQSDNRFFRQELARELAAQLQIPVAPLLQVNGMAINSDKNLRINQVQVIGIDDRFGQFRDEPLPVPAEDEAIISRNTAIRLKIEVGDALLLRLQKKGKAPSNAPFVAEKRPSVSVRVKVTGIADDQLLGRFSLKNNQTAPYNIFLSLDQMAQLLELPGLANLLLTPGNGRPELTTTSIDSTLGTCWKPADAGIHFETLLGKSGRLSQIEGTLSGSKYSISKGSSTYQITSDRIFFDDSTANTIMSIIPGCESILTYFVNSITSGNRETPYSFVTAANESFLDQPTGKKEIIINEWLSKDLGIGPGDPVKLRYFLMGPLHSLREDSTRFIVKSVITMNSMLSDQRLMPEFPGMSDVSNCRDWDAGAPINLKKIRDRDELYWKNFRGTPKAFIAKETGQQIWGNRFGSYTAFRFNARKTDIPAIEKSLMQKIKPAHAGFFFRPVYQEGQLSATNSTDFGELFLSLSFFILLSALLLTSMLFSLQARSRMAETGLLLSIGFRKKYIFRLMSIEAILVTLAGVIPGILLGIFYNKLLIFGLNTVWNEAVNDSPVMMKINFPTLLLGAVLGILTSMIVLFAGIWKNLRKPPSIQAKGDYRVGDAGSGNIRLNAAIAVTSFVIALGLLIWSLITGQTMNVALFLASGGLMLMGGLAAFNLFLRRMAKKRGKSIPGFSNLVFRNISTQRTRTIAAVALLSLGTFIVIITGANHKTFYGSESSRASGTGGFLFWAETVIPIDVDLNSPEGAAKFGLQDEKIFEPVRFIQLSRLDGDDASCLNLNQVTSPVILGVPSELFNRRKSFSMVSADSYVDKNQPWKSLSTSLGPNTIPGFADQTVITWGLRKSIGDTLFYRDEYGRTLKIKLVAGLANSIFQGNVLVSDSLLRIFFPSLDGSRVILVDGPASQRDTIARRLETLLGDWGIMITPASLRLSSFNAVENTYLMVFMLLGGLGIILGTIGLGIVLLRNIQQRQPELSVYLALGFKKNFILKCIVAEHLLILVSGLFLGSISALTGILPSLVSPAYKTPVLLITGILLVIMVNGFLWIWIPAKAAMKKDLLSGLRYE